MNSTLQLVTRAATADDLPLLQTLLGTACVQEFAALGLAPDQLEPLIQMQFHARQQGYATIYPDAVDTILCLADGTPIGRILTQSASNGVRIVDMAILPEHRNQRIGAWAIHTAQLDAAKLDVPLRLRVVKSNRAVRLYKRQGFFITGQDELSFEMEWRMLPSTHGLSDSQITDRIVYFLRRIGLGVELAPLSINGFLPGIQMIRNGLRIDRERLLYPGDLLHEAGHLAVMPPAQRNTDFPEPVEMGEEIAATAWSYAAAIHLGIPMEQVIHDNGYRGSAMSLRDGLSSGQGVGIPLLEWMGLTHERTPANAGKLCYPHMSQWLRRTEAAGGIDQTASEAEGFVPPVLAGDYAIAT